MRPVSQDDAARAAQLEQRRARFRKSMRTVYRRIKRLRAFMSEFRLWLIALVIGLASGHLAVAFVCIVDFFTTAFYGAGDKSLATVASGLPWWQLLLIPAFGGFVIGAIYRLGDVELRPLGVADVIEARALNEARLDVKQGAFSTLSAALSLGFGASGGREGPVVVAGAALSTIASNLMRLSAFEARILMGCAVAAAVSASFNAPIAGALFALEVILGHYAIRAFAPIAGASVAGALLSRYYLGAAPAFSIPDIEFGTHLQFPAFLLLGILCAAVAVTLMLSIFFARDVMDGLRARLGLPLWLQTTFAGLALGAIAIFFPHIISVGYETTTKALAGQFDFNACVVFAVVKTAAVAITLGGRFAGGIFSPALMLGALTGAAFGAVAIQLLPENSGDLTLYALAGMGAVSGAALGAPISTVLIVFELTGDYDTAIAVMISTSVATVATQQIVERSFFHWSLNLRGIDLRHGPQTFLLRRLKVGDLMRPQDRENGASDTAAWALVDQRIHLQKDDNLYKALPMFRKGKRIFLPVVAAHPEGAGDTLIGALFYVDALRAYNRALVEMHAEEHS